MYLHYSQLTPSELFYYLADFSNTLLDKPGLGISDVTKDTLAFAIRLPNTAIDYTGTDSRYVGTKVGQDPDNDWTKKIINIDELEYITGYNFLSNIPTEIQESIEEQSVGDIKAKLKAIVTSTASLMAATEENLFPLAERTHFNATIGHGGIPNQIETSTKSGIVNSSISEVSISQNGVLKSINTSSTENSTSGIDVIQVGSAQIGLNQITPLQVGREQTSIPDNSAFQIGFYQDSTSQISPSQIGFSQIGISQIGSAQIDSAQIKSSQVNQLSGGSSFRLEQLNSRKVSLPISIPKPQLFRSNFPSHNLTSNFFFNLKYTGTEFWKDLLKPETLFDIERMFEKY